MTNEALHESQDGRRCERERKKSTHGGKATVEMDIGVRQIKAEGVPPIIASSGAVTSFIFTHYKVFFCLTAISRIYSTGPSIPPRYGLSA